MKKQRIGGIISASVGSLLIATPSYGFINIDDFFSSIISDIKSEVSDIKTKAQSEVDKAWAGIKDDAQAAIDNSIGEMGAPDPIASSQQLKNRIKDDYSFPVAQEQGQALERELTLATVASVVGQGGQQQTTQKIDTTTQIAQQATDIADAAQNMDASQNILKAISAQNGLVVSMLAQQRTDTLLARQDTSYSNLMLTQVAEHLASQRQQKNSEKEGLLSLLHEVALNARLDPASSD